MLKKDNIKEQVIAYIQRNETVGHEINAVYNETDNKLKQSSNECMKIPASENEYNKLENRQPLKENPD